MSLPPSTASKPSYGKSLCFPPTFTDFDRYALQPVPVPAEVVQQVRERVAKALAPGGQLLNLYVWGSRFYLNASTNSDYDLVAIVTGMCC